MAARLKINILIITVFFSMNLFADWSVNSANHAKTYKFPHDNPFWGSVWGKCNMFKRKIKNKNYLLSTQYLQLDELEKKLPLTIGLQKENKNVKSAPLIFVIPGAFNNLNDDQPQMILNRFLKLGYHVVIFPNPLGLDFIKASPNFKLANFQAEGIVIHQAMMKIYNKLAQSGALNGEVEILGISYGAFMTSIVSAIDSYSAKSIINGTTTLISPPYNIYQSLSLLDEVILDSKDSWHKTNIFKVLWNVLKICRKKGDIPLRVANKYKSKVIAVQMGFKAHLIDSLQEYNKLKPHDAIPEKFFKGRRPHNRRGKGLANPAYSKWKKDLHFASYFQTISPELLPLYQSEKASIEYWLDLLRHKKTAKIRVLTSDDDFINEAYVWNNFHDDLILLKDGGHFGFQALKWFDEFLEISYALN